MARLAHSTRAAPFVGKLPISGKRGQPPAERPLPPRASGAPPCPIAVALSAYAQTAPAPSPPNPILFMRSIRGGVPLPLPVWAKSATSSLFVRPKCRVGGNPAPSFRQTPPSPPPDSASGFASNRLPRNGRPAAPLRGKWVFQTLETVFPRKRSDR